jgi:HEPN domain-containing protein
VVKTPRREARLYLAKAVQFVQEAKVALAASRNDAAILNAVHAGISAADTVCVGLGGVRSAESDHQRAADLLQEVGGKSPEVSSRASQLSTLLAKKNAVEYESRQATAREADEAVKRAERLVSWASQTIERARL